MKKTDVKTILGRGVEEVIVRENIEKKLKSGKKLRVKFGIDPTRPDIHLGHTVPLRKLRQFQDAGHTVVLIIGDFTAQIGDPSGRSEERKPLSAAEVKRNMKNYAAYAGKIIDLTKAEIHYNSVWHKKGLGYFLSITRAVSVQQLLRREDFQKRIREGNDITELETLYPLLQGYDSVAVKADVEIGGTDQKFNLLMGRRVQRYFGLPEQDILTLPLLEGTDGVQKMSKSYDNYVGIDDDPNDMFGKLMAIPDTLIGKYFTLLTDIDAPKGCDPYAAKMLLAETIVRTYHTTAAAKKARENFLRVFSKKEAPEQIEVRIISPKVLSRGTIATLDALGFEGKSKSEWRRLLSQNAIKVNNRVVNDPYEKRNDGDVIKIGKKRFIKIKSK